MNLAAQVSPSLRLFLRAETDDIHTALHRAAPFARIADGTIDRARYGRLLAMLHRYHAGMAQRCAAGAAALELPELGALHQARIARLEHDLACLGVMPADLPSETELPSPDFCVGALYTVQGSTLGGKMINRQLSGLLPAAGGRSFFAGGPQDGALWQKLCTRLENYAGDWNMIKAGARDGFVRFAALLPLTD